MAAQTWELKCEAVSAMMGSERKLNDLLARWAADGWDLVWLRRRPVSTRCTFGGQRPRDRWAMRSR